MSKVTKTRIYDDEKEYTFELYENTEPINIGDYYLFWFGSWCIAQCETLSEHREINPNGIVKQKNIIDFVAGFWKNCFKIKSTNYNL